MTGLAGLPLVSLVTFVPLIGAVLIAFLPSDRPQLVRYAALGVALLTWLVSIVLLVGFTSTDHAFQFVEHADWIPMFGIQYKVGVDGLSMALVVLTTTLTAISILASTDTAHSTMPMVKMSAPIRKMRLRP